MKTHSNFSLYHYSYLNCLIYWCDRRLHSVFLHMIWRKSASYAKLILKHLPNRITGQPNFTPPLTALLLSEFGEKSHIFSGSVRPGTNPGAASSSGMVWCGPCQSLASSWANHGQGCWRRWAASGLSFWAWGCMSQVTKMEESEEVLNYPQTLPKSSSSRFW